MAAVATVTLNDPTVLWTIGRTAQFMSYITVLDLVLPEDLRDFLLSYQSVVAIPNWFLDNIESEESGAPRRFQRYAKRRDEFKTTHFVINAGRYITILAALVGLSLLASLTLGLVPKLKPAAHFIVFITIGFWKQFAVDIAVCAMVSLLSDDSETSLLSVIPAGIMLGLIMVTPIAVIIHANTLKGPERTSVFLKDYQLFHWLGVYQESFLSLRRTAYAASVYFLYENPVTVLFANTSVCLIIFYLMCRRRPHISLASYIVACLSELVLALTFVCAGLHLWLVADKLKYVLMGANIGLIIISTVLTVISVTVTVYKKCRRKSSKTAPEKSASAVSVEQDDGYLRYRVSQFDGEQSYSQIVVLNHTELQNSALFDKPQVNLGFRSAQFF